MADQVTHGGELKSSKESSRTEIVIGKAEGSAYGAALAYLTKEEVRTAQRWETEFELPVHRTRNESGSAVMALLDELEAWLQARPAGPDSSRQPSSEPTSASTAQLNECRGTLITDLLWKRPSRPPDLNKEIQVLRQLLPQIAHLDPEKVLNNLVDSALELCKVDAAGVSLPDFSDGGEAIFRWVATAGTMKAHVRGGTPRNFSPCAVCLERNSPQLFAYPERFFTYLQNLGFSIRELLLIPFYADHEVFGTVWVFCNEDRRKFDREDARILTSLTDVVGAAVRMMRLQQRQRETDEYCNSLIEAIPTIVCTARNNGELDYLNQRWVEYTGQSLSDALGWGWRSSIHPADLPTCDELWRNALQAGQMYEVEYRLRRRDGEYRWHLTRAVPLRASDGTVIKWFGTATDIHAQKAGAQRSSSANAV